MDLYGPLWTSMDLYGHLLISSSLHGHPRSKQSRSEKFFCAHLFKPDDRAAAIMEAALTDGSHLKGASHGANEKGICVLYV